MPAVLGLVVAGLEPGLFGDLAGDAAGEVDLLSDDIAGVGGAGREIDLSRIRRLRPHHPQDEGAIAGDNGAGGEAVPDRRIGKATVAPRTEARAAGFETGAAKCPALDRVVVQQQDAAVPDAGMAPLELDKIAIDLGAALARERPRPRRKRKLQPLDAHDGDVVHAASVPSVTITA